MIGLPSTNTIAIACLLVIGAATGWSARAWKAEAEMATFKEGLAATAQDQRDLKAKVEAAQAVSTAKSTERLDQQQAAQQKETVYVEKEVIRYRDRWRESACRLPAEWLQLYNRTLGATDGTVPNAATLRPAPVGSAVRTAGAD